MNQQIKELKNKLAPRVKEQEILAPYTTFKIGGPADLFIDVKTTQEFFHAVFTARECGVPIYILGGGTNILIGDKGIRGLVIKNSTSRIQFRGMRSSGKQVYLEADSGVLINKLVRFTVDEGLAGLEMHLGLPGTVGGAVYMNSKWTHPDGYVGDVVYQAEIVTPEGERKKVPRQYFSFAYDTSSIQKTGDIVLSVTFALRTDKKERLWQIANESIGYRRSSQPQGVKSAGCTFQNVNGTSAGLLVDKAGLKGVQIGDAQISPMHANFIVNLGSAKASDVIQLIHRAKEQVKRQFGITLAEEIVTVGEF